MPAGGIAVMTARARSATRFAAAADAVMTGFTANVAARRGGRLFSTKSIEEARQWLFNAAG